MIDVSVIIPVYNVEKYLAKCMGSLLNQSYHNFEIILVDDGSSDRSGEICDDYQKMDERVRVIHQRNQGVAAARNNGLENSAGEYVYFCDPDDYVENSLIEENVNLIKNYRANLVIFGYYDEKVTEKGNTLIVRAPRENRFFKTKDEFRNQFSQLYALSIMYTLWNKLYRKSFIIKNRCVFENVEVGEDTRFNLSVYKELDKVCINKNKYYHYIVQRYESAANKYRSNGFEIRYREIHKLSELVTYWGYDKIDRDLIKNEWLLTLYIGIKSLFHKQCPLNESEKRQKILEYMSKPEVKKELKDLSFNDLSGSLKEKIKKLIYANADKTYIYHFLNFLYKIN